MTSDKSQKLSNILVVSPIYPTLSNGTPSYVKWLVDELQGTLQVTVLTPDTDTIEQTPSCMRLSLPTPTSAFFALKSHLHFCIGFLTAFWTLYRLCKSRRIDVVHCTFHSYNYFFRLLRKVGGPRYIVTLHGSETMFFEDIPANHRKLAKWVVEGADQVVAVSHALSAVAEKTFSLRRPVNVIANGIRTLGEKSSPSSEIPHPLPESGFSLMVARLHKVKGVDIAINTWKKVLDKKPGEILVIIGDGELRQDCEQQACQLGISQQVLFWGAQKNNTVKYAMRHAKLLLMTSRSEGLPIACLEAGTESLPIVASNVGGIPEIITHGKSGLLVESENTQAFSKQVLQLLNDKDLRIRLGKQLNEDVQHRFSSAGCAAEYIKIYEIISGKKP